MSESSGVYGAQVYKLSSVCVRQVEDAVMVEEDEAVWKCTQ